MSRTKTLPETGEVGPVSNGGARAVAVQTPYTVNVRIRGVSDMLFHRWLVEAVEAKANAAKGSKEKKTDNVETFVYRNNAGEICLPGEYLRQSIIHAAKYIQDPRSPRKSAMDIYKAGVVALTQLAPIGRAGTTFQSWEYEHKCRVTIQRSAITRTRPAFKEGWEAEVQLMVNLPEYITPEALKDRIDAAGRLIGVGDFRPTYGRFTVMSYDIGLNP